MQTKTFSGRADTGKLAYADALAEQEYGMSYGQFCSSILLDYIQYQHAFPDIPTRQHQDNERVAALKRLREMREQLRGSYLADMTDAEMKQRIASRYA